MVWYRIGVQVHYKTLNAYGCLEIGNVSSTCQKISSSSLDERFRISARPSNILYITWILSRLKNILIPELHEMFPVT